MSLIIDVLKELETRENHLHPVLPVMATHPWPLHTKNNLVLKVATGITLLFICLLAFFLISHTHQKITAVPMLPTKPQPIPVNATVNNLLSPWLSPVTISGVSLSIKDNITELTFSLNHNTLYRLETYAYNNSTALVFDHASFNAALPSFENANTALSELANTSLGSETRFTFILKPTASIKSVNLLNEANDPQLVIAFDNGEHTVNSEPIKTPALQSLVNQAFDSATALLQQGNKVTAMETLKSILASDPSHERARIALAALLLSENKLASANTLINDGLKRLPDSLPLLELKARMLSDAGNTPLAIQILVNASPSVTESPSTYVLLAALYEKNNDETMAAQTYRDLTTLNAHQGTWWLGLGIALDKLGKTNSAIAAYQKAAIVGGLTTTSFDYLQERLHQLEGADHDSA